VADHVAPESHAVGLGNWGAPRPAEIEQII
jgi:hypothetical protein